MCNAFNHPPECTCGWGGEYHSTRAHVWKSTRVAVRIEWQYGNEDFTRPTTCPYCRKSVFFVRHNGGSVWFDDLGQPWPKHGCFVGKESRSEIDLHNSLKRRIQTGADVNLARIESVNPTPRNVGGYLQIRCSNGKVVERRYMNCIVDPKKLAGVLGIITQGLNGKSFLDILGLEGKALIRLLLRDPNAKVASKTSNITKAPKRKLKSVRKSASELQRQKQFRKRFADVLKVEGGKHRRSPRWKAFFRARTLAVQKMILRRWKKP